MSDSNRDERSKTLAAIGYVSFAVAVGAIYFWMFYDMGASAARYRVEQQQASQAHAERAADEVRAECAGSEAPAACERKIEQAARERQRNEKDLEAQRGMSDWAFWLLVISAFQFPATLVALVFVKRTLDATLEAVADTGRATVAMERQNEITRDAQRAWVTLSATVNRVIARPSKGLELNVEFVAKNLGQTTAKNFNVEITVLFMGQAESDDAFNDRLDAVLEEWKRDGYVPKKASLLPHDTQVDKLEHHYGDEEIEWWSGHGWQEPRVMPVLLVAAFYRTVNDPKTQHLSWRSWNISTRNKNATRFRRGVRQSEVEWRGEDVRATPHYLSLMHEEYPANDDSRHHG